jgi:hypothetical protein
VSSATIFTSRCLTTSSNIGRSSASELTSYQSGGHLTPTSYSSNYPLKSFSSVGRLNCCWTSSAEPFLASVSSRYMIKPRDIASTPTKQKTALPTVTTLLRVTQLLLNYGCFSLPWSGSEQIRIIHKSISSWMWRLVFWHKFIDVSEELTASVFRL